MSLVIRIELDASQWKTGLDFYDALLTALGAPHWHGRSVDALIDSMVYRDINTIESPYTIAVTGADKMSARAVSSMVQAILALGKAGADAAGIKFRTSPMTAEWVPDG